MYSVYLIKSINFSNKIYIGFTTDINQRLETHNFGGSVHTAKYKPWELIVYHVFKNEVIALRFEKYLKSGSG